MGLKNMFDKIKGSKKNTTLEELEKETEVAQELLEKAENLQQEKLSEKLKGKILFDNKVKELLERGYDTYVLREDVIKFVNIIQKEEAKKLGLIELKNYSRDIPQEQYELILQAKGFFDDIYILYTDQTKEIEELKKEKDPIAFGVLKNEKYGMDARLFFICDWVDEYCDLTFNEFVEQYKNKFNDTPEKSLNNE